LFLSTIILNNIIVVSRKNQLSNICLVIGGQTMERQKESHKKAKKDDWENDGWEDDYDEEDEDDEY
jgi:hypothetical protein